MDLPFRSKPLGHKWVFKMKMKADDIIDKYKAILVFKWFRQQKCIDYFDIYSYVSRIIFIKVLITIITITKIEIYQIDVKTTFLNGDLDEEVYIE
jgi:hypothetical protein